MHCKEKTYWDKEGNRWLVCGHGTALESWVRDVWMLKVSDISQTVYFQADEWDPDEPLDMESKGFYPEPFPQAPKVLCEKGGGVVDG